MAGIGRRIVAYLKGEYADDAERAKFNFNFDTLDEGTLTIPGIGCCGTCGGNTSAVNPPDNSLHRHDRVAKKDRWVR